MQKKTKLIGNIIFMLLLLGATMYLLLKDQDLPEIRRLLQGASGSMILFAVLCAVIDTVSQRRAAHDGIVYES